MQYHYRRTPNPRTLAKHERERIYIAIKREFEGGPTCYVRRSLGIVCYAGHGATQKDIRYLKAWFLYRFNPWIWADYVRWRRGLKSLLD